MTKTPTPVKRTRPGAQATIDLKVVEGMAGVGATNVEIADFLGLNEGTIRKRCGDTLTKARASLKTRLRQAQLKAALGGNPALLIWLGKQMLGQSDQSKLDLTSAGHQIVTPPILWSDQIPSE
ncbi:RNA polymerase sigma factor [Brevundimonas sp.]|uniref:RNA polymerase sigma factor n=1 Tax=Brevundimonas sp. TaxID=1871086 RepID=UPI003563C779